MLVVIAMGTATALTTAYLLSKDNSAAIGDNANDTAASAWAARSGADLALAVLQTEEDWVDAEPEKLLEGFAIGDGTVSVALTDMEGLVPDGTETDLAMTVVADVNGIKTVLQRIVSMPPEVVFDDAVDPELGEFGLYATDELIITTGSSVAVWPASPMAKSGGANNIGVGFTNAANLYIHGSAKLMASRLFVRPDSNNPLKSAISGSEFIGGGILQLPVPVIESRLPGVFSGLVAWPTSTYYDDIYRNGYFEGDQLLSVVSPGESITLVGGRHKDLLVENAGPS
jgi:hypothetical protein